MSEAHGPLTMFITLGTHCDLFWMGTHTECLERGTAIQRRALELMEQHPDYCYYIETTIFAEYHLRRYPEDKARMQRLMERGQLEVGACFVDRIEHSHHGESLVRQAVEGGRWLRETFGPGPRTVCHPDLPGMSPQVPQVYAQAGVSCYLRARGFGAVYHWTAPDGSSILYCNLFGYGDKRLADFERVLQEPTLPAYFFVRGGYADLGEASDAVLGIVSELRQRHPQFTFQFASPGRVLAQLQSQPLPQLSGEMPFGWGSVGSAFVRLMAQSVELEHRLLTAEKLLALARGQGLTVRPTSDPLADLSRHPQPHRRLPGNLFGDPIPEGEELRELWRCELFCQDHNYGGRHGAQSNWDKEVLRDHALTKAARWVEGGLRALADGGEGEQVVVFNPLSWARDEVVTIPDETPETLQAVGPDGVPLPTQPTEDGLAVELTSLPPLALQSFRLVHSRSTIRNLQSLGGQVESWLHSEQMEVEVDAARGRISRLFDRTLGRDLVEPEAERGFGELVSYRDPGVDVRYNFTGEVESDSLVDYEVVRREDGPVLARLTVAGVFLESRVEKEFTLYKRLRRVDLRLRLWWWGAFGEHLRLCFPFASKGFQETWYGVPFYAMRWPQMLHGDGVSDDLTLEQGLTIPDMLLPADRRHFREVIGWLEVGYGDHGVTVGTRSTCWWIHGPELHASLLRTQFSCGDPNLWNLNPGFHEWTFRLVPHAGDWREGKAYRRGEETLNAVPLVRKGGKGEEEEGRERKGREGWEAVGVVPEHVMVTALKPSDFASEAIVVRVLECEGRPAEVLLTFPFPFRHAEAVNLLEEPAGPVAVEGRSVRIPLRPWQFQTIRLWRE